MLRHGLCKSSPDNLGDALTPRNFAVSPSFSEGPYARACTTLQDKKFNSHNKINTPLSCSVAIATYNGSRYIRQQLESIISQSVRPNEIIISDDGSSDDTTTIARNILSSSGISFKIVRNSYASGYTTNFSNALENTIGEIVFICDQDDIWLPNKIQTVLNIFSTSDAELIVHDAHVWWSEQGVYGPLLSKVLVERGIEPESNIYGCMMAVRRILLDATLPIDTNAIGHDTLLSLVSVSRQSRYYVDKPLIIWAPRKTSASRTLGKITTS